MRGKRPEKHPDQLQGHRSGRGRNNAPIQKPEPGQVVVIPPAMPTGLLKSTRDKWEAFWKSSVARTVDQRSDMLVERLFRYYDEWERCSRVFRRKRIVTGSTGQPVINPAGKAMLDLETRIIKLEERIGLTPRDRMALGIQAATAKTIVDELGDAFDEEDEDEEFEVPEGVRVIDGTARAV